MTFQDVKFGRVVQSVVLIFFTAIVMYFVLYCSTLLLVPGLLNRFEELGNMYLDMIDDEADQQVVVDELEGEFDTMVDDYRTELYIQSLFQWSLGVLVTFMFARRAARSAAFSPEQATGYGVLIGLGSMMTFGLLCMMCNDLVAQFLVRVMFMGFLVGAGYLGGWMAGNNLDPAMAAAAAGPGLPPDLANNLPPGLLTQPQGTPPGGGDPAVFYNMGVAAALGGRRDEARQHFTRTLQMQPRNIAAWLQLANLADTPEQAWGYIQQARAISPNDPSVVEAVNVIWPQVHARSLQSSAPPVAAPPPTAPPPTAQPPTAGLPSVQPPYQGGAQDNTDIPRTTLPGSDDPDDVS